MPKTELDKHIEYLRSVNDCREDFWRKVKDWITKKDYKSVFRAVFDHDEDSDFEIQIELVAGEIAAQHPWHMGVEFIDN